jgi:hypothetical protein
MTENHTVLDNVLRWLHDGYPEGVPPKDYWLFAVEGVGVVGASLPG